jgi:hypothetical protein
MTVKELSQVHPTSSGLVTRLEYHHIDSIPREMRFTQAIYLVSGSSRISVLFRGEWPVSPAARNRMRSPNRNAKVRNVDEQNEQHEESACP